MSEEIVSTTEPTLLPKPTTADDLLEMYDEIPDEPVAGAEPGTNSQSPTPQNGEKATTESKTLVDTSIKAKDGDTEVSIPKEAKIPLTVNGKEVEVTVEQALKAYQSQDEFNRNMDTRLATANNKERSVNAAFQNLLGQAQKVADLAQKGDYLGVKS
jgi:hypothetical protein